MTDKNILEIKLSNLSIVNNCVADEFVAAVLSINWNHPRENIQSVLSAVAIAKVSDGFNRDYSQLAYANKILFKEERRGTSSLSLELAVVSDANILGKIMTTLIAVGVGSIASPYLGAGVGTIIKELNLDEKKVTIIGKGNVELGSTETELVKDITLKTPKKIDIYSNSYNDSLFDDEEDPDNDLDVIVINPNTVNGSVQIQINTL